MVYTRKSAPSADAGLSWENANRCLRSRFLVRLGRDVRVYVTGLTWQA